MMGIILLAILLIFGSLAMALVAASPLFRSISTLIDCWADGVHGDGADQLR